MSGNIPTDQVIASIRQLLTVAGLLVEPSHASSCATWVRSYFGCDCDRTALEITQRADNVAASEP